MNMAVSVKKKDIKVRLFIDDLVKGNKTMVP